jgi:hypothetical protein
MSTRKIRISISLELFDFLWKTYTEQPRDKINREDYRYLYRVKCDNESGMRATAFEVTHALAEKKNKQAIDLGFDPIIPLNEPTISPQESAYKRWCIDPLLLNEEQTALADEYRVNNGLMSEDEEMEWNMGLMARIEIGAAKEKERKAKERKENGLNGLNGMDGIEE